MPSDRASITSPQRLASGQWDLLLPKSPWTRQGPRPSISNDTSILSSDTLFVSNAVWPGPGQGPLYAAVDWFLCVHAPPLIWKKPPSILPSSLGSWNPNEQTVGRPARLFPFLRNPIRQSKKSKIRRILCIPMRCRGTIRNQNLRNRSTHRVRLDS